MAHMAMAIPVLPGKEEAWQSFLEELKGPRREEFLASRRRMGVEERTFIQKTPQGWVVIVTLEGDDPAGALGRFAEGTDPFTTWFLEQAREVHGMDLREPPPGPMPELVIDTTRG